MPPLRLTAFASKQCCAAKRYFACKVCFAPESVTAVKSVAHLSSPTLICDPHLPRLVDVYACAYCSVSSCVLR